jgi:large repetitive protein
VFAEFEIMVTSSLPTSVINLGATALMVTPSSALGLAPMQIANAGTAITLTLKDSNAGDHTADLTSAAHHAPLFPIGVWGLPQADDDRKIPTGDVIDAIDGVLLSAVATIPPGLPPIDYRHRVETGARLPLPFVHESSERPQFMTDAAGLAALLPVAPTVDQVFAKSGIWMSRAGNGRTAMAAMRLERASPPRFGSLTDGLAAATPPEPDIALPGVTPAPPTDTRVQPPIPIAVITAAAFQTEEPPIRTTALRAGAAALVMTPPTLESVAAKIDLAAPAQLHIVAGAGGQVQNGTIVAMDASPLTRIARGGLAAMSGRGAIGDGQARLASLLPSATAIHTAPTLRKAFDAATRAARRDEREKKRRLAAGARTRAAVRATEATPDAELLAGEIAVLRLPNATRDLDRKTVRPRLNVLGGPARVVVFAHGGEVLADGTIAPGGSRVPGFALPLGAERVAVAVAGATNADAPGMSGWIVSTALAYVGWATAIVAGAVVRVENASVTRTRHRRTAGWIRGAEFVDGTSLVITRFADSVTTIVIALDDPGADEARNLSLGLAGAARALQADGSTAPPRAVVRANRTFLIYDIVPEGKKAVTVTVASNAGWRLAGVLGGPASGDVVASWATGRGLDALVRQVLPGVGGSRKLQWIGVQPPPIDRPGWPEPRIVSRSQYAQGKPLARTRAASSRKRTKGARKSSRRRRRR